MIKILIAEDNAKKCREVTRFLEERFAQEANVTSASSVSAAIKILSTQEIDLLILDLFLPIVHGGSVQSDGGAALLKEVIRRSIKTPRYVVGLTAQAPEVVSSADIFNEYSSFLVIHFQPGAARWKKQLADQIAFIVSRNESPAHAHGCDYAIISALADPEFRQVLNLFPELSPTSHKGDPTTYYTATLKTSSGEKKIVAAHAAKMGMCSSAVLTAKIIERYRPSRLIMTGIAAGIRENVQLRDVLIPNYVFALEAGKRKREGDKVVFLPSPDPLSIDGAVNERINHLRIQPSFLFDILNKWPADRPATHPELRIGAMGTGISVIQDSKFAASLIEDNDRKIIGIDMEAYAVILACSSHCTGIIIKCVSDFADEEKNDGQQNICSYLSAAVARKLIMDCIFD